MLREFVVNWLGTEDGTDEVLRRAWARSPWGRVPGGFPSTYREGGARVAPESAVQRRKPRRYQQAGGRQQPARCFALTTLPRHPVVEQAHGAGDLKIASLAPAGCDTDNPCMLTFFNKARAALARAVTVDEAKEIRDKAEALRIYAKQARHAGDMERQCAEIRLRAERRIGELLAQTVKPGNPQLSHDATIGLSELGITRSQSSRWQLAATLPEEDFERYVATSRELSTAGVLRLVWDRKRRRAGPSSGGHILTGPACRLREKLPDNSVDLFLTDPPYAEIECYRELAELAAVKLKPGGLCLAYCGQTYLPDVLTTMARHLTYHWTFAIRFAGPHRPIYPKQIQNTWQPVVAFSRGKAKPGWIVDMLESGGREKSDHDHQKTLSDVEYLIEKLTSPGSLVVDPFCGSGTVPAACKTLGRRWLACEFDSGTTRVARRRVA